MEWVETTGKDVTEAKDLALDQLGVDEGDAEFEVLEEPRTGLFGRVRGVARVRARVLPKAPRPKQERRRRRSEGERTDSRSGERTGQERRRRGGSAGSRGGDAGSQGASQRKSEQGGAKGSSAGGGRAAAADGTSGARTDGPQGPERTGRQRQGSKRQDSKGREAKDRDAHDKEREMMDAAEQRSTIDEFLVGLCKAFGLETTVDTTVDEDGTVRASIDGSEVGLLIGPRLGTLEAIQEICRNVLQRRADGREHGKVILDVAGVREMRRSALAAFVTDAAGKVREEGSEVTFEVMSSADRKVVHDTVADLEGVESSSVGEDPRRRVVLRPS